MFLTNGPVAVIFARVTVDGGDVQHDVDHVATHLVPETVQVCPDLSGSNMFTLHIIIIVHRDVDGGRVGCDVDFGHHVEDEHLLHPGSLRNKQTGHFVNRIQHALLR